MFQLFPVLLVSLVLDELPLLLVSLESIGIHPALDDLVVCYALLVHFVLECSQSLLLLILLECVLLL